MNNSGMVSWLETPLGRAFFEQEKKVVSKLITHLFGFHALLVGESPFLSMFETSPIQHRICLNALATKPFALGNALCGRQDKLPILNDAVDLVYLAHTLEFTKNPHEVLREAYRVLVSEGHLVIAGFNPWSSWGFLRWLLRWTNHTPWEGQFISLLRLKDWLTLLGFDVVTCFPFFSRLPVNHTGFLQGSSFLESWGRWFWPFGEAGYVLLAKKRVMTLTPMKPVFRTARQFDPIGGAVSVE